MKMPTDPNVIKYINLCLILGETPTQPELEEAELKYRPSYMETEWNFESLLAQIFGLINVLSLFGHSPIQFLQEIFPEWEWCEYESNGSEREFGTKAKEANYIFCPHRNIIKKGGPWILAQKEDCKHKFVYVPEGRPFYFTTPDEVALGRAGFVKIPTPSQSS